jgi:hypothetical protein
MLPICQSPKPARFSVRMRSGEIPRSRRASPVLEVDELLELREEPAVDPGQPVISSSSHPRSNARKIAHIRWSFGTASDRCSALSSSSPSTARSR